MPYGDPQEVRRLKEIYEKVRLRLEKQILIYLVKKNLIPNENKFDLAPDFSNIEEWKIVTNVRKVYTSESIFIEKEDILRIKGLLYITKFTLNMDPSFLFDIDVPEKSISLNPEDIKKIIQKDESLTGWQKELIFDDNKIFNISDKNTEKLLKKLETNALPMLKGIGFSEDESKMMVLGAMENENFTPDILPENLVGLALKIRGQALTDGKVKG